MYAGSGLSFFVGLAAVRFFEICFVIFFIMKKSDLFNTADKLADKSKGSKGWLKVLYITLAIAVAAAGLFFGTASCSGKHEFSAGFDKNSGAYGFTVKPVRVFYGKK